MNKTDNITNNNSGNITNNDETKLIDLVNISKSFGYTQVIRNLNLYIRKNEFITLLGPSGCGKTTTLRIIGGFEQPTEGHVLYNGHDITNLPPYKRNVNTVFQKYSLFPHMNIFENVAYGLRLKKTPKDIISEKVCRMLELVDLKGFEKRSVDSLSGGQQQRIAIARALVNEPEVLLLDEPLGALDLKLRKEMQLELKRIQQSLGITFVYVTHDQEEALTMSDTIVVMNSGIIQQIDTPLDLYNEPKNAFVAQFIGESNLLTGIMKKNFLCFFAENDFVCEDKGFARNEDVDVVIRPEDIIVSPAGSGQIDVTVTDTVFKGVHYEMTARNDNYDYDWKINNTTLYPKGSNIGITINPHEIHIMRIATNIVSGWILDENTIEVFDKKFECNTLGIETDDMVNVFIKPVDIGITNDPDNENAVEGIVETLRDKGEDYEITVKVSDQTILVHCDDKMQVGQTIGLIINSSLFKIEERERVELEIDEEGNISIESVNSDTDVLNEEDSE